MKRLKFLSAPSSELVAQRLAAARREVGEISVLETCLRTVVAAALLLPLFGLPSARPLAAETVAVRYPQGTAHGFLALRTLQGTLIATGDLVQTVHANRVTSHVLFRFRDGSVDDDTAVFTQGSSFHLESEHHVQRGPSFPKPIDITLHVPAGLVASRVRGDDGGEKVTTQHMDLPPDLANGMFLTLITNIPPTKAKTTLPMVVPFAGARLIHLSITPLRKVQTRVGGTTRRAQEFLVKIEIGGLTGMIAPLIGKKPHDVHVWILEGAAPAFIREEGPLFEGGPIWRIEQISPTMRK